MTTAPAEADADGCAVGVADDFNGDGRADVVAGDPQARFDVLDEAGVIQVRYGDASGLVGFGEEEVIWQNKGGEGLIPQAGARYGSALATADVDCDGYTDILVGAPLYDWDSGADAGLAQLVRGGPGGAGSGGTTVYSAADFGNARAEGDQFGFSVDILEDVGQGGTPAPDAYAMAIGVPYRDAPGANDTGAVALRTAYDGGSVSAWIDQETDGVPGGSESGDRFGSAVAFGDLNGGDVDALVGAPGENVGSVTDAGSVTLLEGVYGDEIADAIVYTQNSSGVPGTVEAGDRFGDAIEIVRSESTTFGAIGIPREDVGSAANAGSVQLFRGGSPVNWTTALTQDTAGVAGSAETGDRFGTDVAIARGTNARLAVGTPSEDIGSIDDAGTAQLFRLDSLANDISYSQNTSGILGAPHTGDAFGSAVGFVDGPGENVLLIGVPLDTTYTRGLVTYVPYPSGDPRTWNPVSPNGRAFGSSLASEGR